MKTSTTKIAAFSIRLQSGTGLHLNAMKTHKTADVQKSIRSSIHSAVCGEWHAKKTAAATF